MLLECDPWLQYCLGLRQLSLAPIAVSLPPVLLSTAALMGKHLRDICHNPG
ncbi:hypothetical protein [Infirmifilum uzonense]|uniref:hypothetical protein n=1 Tax=Infirmifilum uzonense TaxID=1550241 RepID=UPI000B18E888|nr:hypothetical protein [Infirmifilum uzonense]